MEGVGRLKNLETPSPNVRTFAHGDYWAIAEEPLHSVIDAVDIVHHGGQTGEALEAAREQNKRERVNGAGLGLTFGKAVSERTGVSIDLLPVAHGGTTISQWSPDLKYMAGGSFYGAMLRRIKLALETGGDIKLRGILWYQGEFDGNPENAPHYLKRTIHFIEQLRVDLSCPNLPLFLAQLGCWNMDSIPGDETATAWQTVREAQRLIPTMVPRTVTVPTIDLELDDGVHIATESLKRLGRRFANVAINKAYGREAAAGPVLKSVRREENIIRVSYDNVSRLLITPDRAGRVFGYSIASGTDKPKRFPIFTARTDPENPSDVLLYLDQSIAPDSKLYYGEGVFPMCQLIDAEDMAAPAFGPVAIN
jgi:sialate O-acetylesterase